jgi:hypothetical protein
MDFLDPVKERRNRLILLTGYALVGLAIGIATLVLLYQSYGYGLDRQGKVTLNGLLFVSSQPTGADIYLNNVRYKSNTDSKVNIPADTYNLRVHLEGYRDWQRPIVVNGSDVQHFDYPFLFPITLRTNSLTNLVASPSFSTQSPDKRWWLLGRADASGSFVLTDLKNPDKPVTTTVILPDGSFTTGDTDGAQSWQTIEWAADNRHVLLQHTYSVKGVSATEYILLDRDTPVDSVNLTASLHLAQGQTLNLYNNRISQFYVLNPSAETLERIDASDSSVQSKLEHVVAFKPYGNDKLLYVTDQAPTGNTASNTVYVVLQDGQKTITLRGLPAGASNYALNLAQYSGDWYVAVGATNASTVYIYKNPQSETTGTSDTFPAPWRRLPLANPNYLAFSSNTQFLAAENGQDFVIYDFENVLLYRYHVKDALDQPQLHATWMDGDRLMYVSGGKLEVFDYDYRNMQTLVGASSVYTPAFSSDYTYLYTVGAAGTDGKTTLTSTPLTIKK